DGHGTAGRDRTEHRPAAGNRCRCRSQPHPARRHRAPGNVLSDQPVLVERGRAHAATAKPDCEGVIMVRDSRWRQCFRFGSLLALAAPNAALAQAALDADTINKLGSVVRWSGVVTSLLVMIGAWALLRLLARSVDAFSSQFSSRRLTLQKLST